MAPPVLAWEHFARADCAGADAAGAAAADAVQHGERQLPGVTARLQAAHAELPRMPLQLQQRPELAAAGNEPLQRAARHLQAGKGPLAPEAPESLVSTRVPAAALAAHGQTGFGQAESLPQMMLLQAGEQKVLHLRSCRPRRASSQLRPAL